MMKKTFTKICILAGILVYLPGFSMAWGLLGHRIVAEIANSYLNAKARVEIQKILGNESMAMASNWPDFIKSDPSYNYLSKWHYIDFDQSLSYQQMQDFLQQDTATDAYTKLNFLVKELKNKSLPADKKLMYLKLVIHIVGDLHQPLHTGRTEDKGGNTIKVSWFGQQTNLHAVWDEKLIEYQQLSYTEYTKAINYTTPAQRTEWQQQPISKWIYDSNQLAQKIYAGIKPEARLSYRYNFDYVADLNQQLLKGGVRLAGLLNTIFGS
ncbi:S1/P1 nuclease (plasmid) [Pedobacter sp. BS3]|uniref:S1/P1 nuclease n=1 Tax=Pedobacter sp. BS3 TaxID=2567937 RepID=UPI0011EBEA11|nr:S1/P1 nuclease [Pedobacter sp. BS3]TZF85613.1 S1/P1 nuclease [Pedobacter sp. BS3]